MAEDDFCCSVCREPLDDSKLYRMHQGCGHFSHSACLQEIGERCVGCQGPKEPPPASASSSSWFGGLFGRIGYMTAPHRTRNEDPAEVRDPHALVRMGKPDEVLGRLGSASNLVQAGVTIDMLLDNGFTARHLSQLPEVDASTGPAWLVALGATPEHLLRLGHEELGLLGVTPRAIGERFRLHFPPGGVHPLTYPGAPSKRVWTLSEVARLGFSYDNLRSAGLESRSQWLALAPTQELAERMGATPAKLAQLRWAPPPSADRPAFTRAGPPTYPPHASVHPPPHTRSLPLRAAPARVQNGRRGPPTKIRSPALANGRRPLRDIRSVDRAMAAAMRPREYYEHRRRYM